MRFLLVLLLAASAHAQGTGTLAGRVVDAATGETLPGVNIRVQGTTLGAAANMDGEYRIIGIPVGTFMVTASFAGYTTEVTNDVEIRYGDTTEASFALSGEGLGCVIGCYVPPIVMSTAYQSRISRPFLAEPGSGDCCSGRAVPRTPNGVKAADAW